MLLPIEGRHQLLQRGSVLARDQAEEDILLAAGLRFAFRSLRGSLRGLRLLRGPGPRRALCPGGLIGGRGKLLYLGENASGGNGPAGELLYRGNTCQAVPD